MAATNKMFFQLTDKTCVVVEIIGGKLMGTEYTEGVAAINGRPLYEIDGKELSFLEKMDFRYRNGIFEANNAK